MTEIKYDANIVCFSNTADSMVLIFMFKIIEEILHIKTKLQRFRPTITYRGS